MEITRNPSDTIFSRLTAEGKHRKKGRGLPRRVHVRLVRRGSTLQSPRRQGWRGTALLALGLDTHRRTGEDRQGGRLEERRLGRVQTGFLTTTSRAALSCRAERESEPVVQGSRPCATGIFSCQLDDNSLLLAYGIDLATHTAADRRPNYCVASDNGTFS